MKARKKGFFPKIRSRHPSHKALRLNANLKVPFRAGIRLGSTTEFDDDITKGGKRVILNDIDAIKTSSSKFLMKKAFFKAGVKSADFYFFKLSNDIPVLIDANGNEVQLQNAPLPLIAKINYGSRGRGMKKLDTIEQVSEFIKTHKTSEKYYFEKFYNYAREYRLHVNKNGCFYTCRKMIKPGTEEKWYRNNENCIWYKEDNPNFDKPSVWPDIVSECVKALLATGLDFGACDVKVQSEKNKKRKTVEFVILEINSAPSYGDITFERYVEELPKMLIEKRNEILSRITT